ncbi:hypothetical protein Q1695_012859 [Nippostrongylus brasiliensis]|nr:hypothetical protein Q1695_012859 [Nippostrongylus brasiliensis]
MDWLRGRMFFGGNSSAAPVEDDERRLVDQASSSSSSTGRNRCFGFGCDMGGCGGTGVDSEMDEASESRGWPGNSTKPLC